ncbi:hypothetical protein [Legionella maioricensis]|uniref:Tyr recombinase domain-containing protein n=1 Tax=Legionella maioricensis TaxID=2896528 RepID=A0A9X2IAZ8_9GAMM|nr:hypothetical protein [Legionella maioricensis]MCL9682957.1 hypothetical protein [Legionella maioricensis]MCL9686305.1 hypothetical protein [Legionella maioricensis]
MISARQVKELPKTITENQFIQLSNTRVNYRDKFLIWFLYETGLRIGQALSLRHKDIISWDFESITRFITHRVIYSQLKMFIGYTFDYLPAINNY